MRKVNGYSKKIRMSQVLIHFIFILFSLACFIPILIIVSTSFSNETEVLKNGYSLLPQGFTFVPYKLIATDPRTILNAYGTTALITFLGTVFGLFLTTTLAYTISRKDFRYRKIIAFIVFFTMIFNGGLVPSYILIAKWLHMKNTLFALFVPSLVNAYYILLMKGFLQNTPIAIIESAKIDGAREYSIFFKIIIPISKPGIATLAVFYILQYWNEWFSNMLYIDNNQWVTLQYMLIRIMANMEYLKSSLQNALLIFTHLEMPSQTTKMAMCIVASAPMMIIFPFFQKYFTKGLTVGSIKE